MAKLEITTSLKHAQAQITDMLNSYKWHNVEFRPVDYETDTLFEVWAQFKNETPIRVGCVYRTFLKVGKSYLNAFYPTVSNCL